MKALIAAVLMGVSFAATAMQPNDIAKNEIKMFVQSANPQDQAFLATVKAKKNLEVCNDIYAARTGAKSYIKGEYKMWAVKYLIANDAFDANNPANFDAFSEKKIKYGITACTVRMLLGPPKQVATVANADGTKMIQYIYKDRTVFMQTTNVWDIEEDATVRIP